MKKTKIICTIGPSSQSPKALNEMIQAGMNVARLNFSHGDHFNHGLLIKNIRAAALKNKTHVPIIQDLHGPKIRVLKMKQPLVVKPGRTVVIGKDFSLDLDVIKSIRPGQKILIEDGLIELEAKSIGKNQVTCVAMSAGKIQENKGVNLPRTKLKIPILTNKDIEDLKFGLKQDVDFIALSFVRSAADIKRLKVLIKKYLPKNFSAPKIIAKIEKPEAVKNFDSILKETDAVMVARGDLGVEMPENVVPILQKSFVQKCIHAGKPVIVATQMLDSMIRNPRPTRAEVSDVANAVIDQTDCVMLSGETAFGKYPVKAVAEMSRIIETTEKSAFLPAHSHLEKKSSNADALAESVFHLAEHTKAKAIVGATDSGFTAREVAKERPSIQTIIMLTPNRKTLHQISLLWGVNAHLIPKVKSFEQLMELMIKTIKQRHWVKKGQKIIVVTGEPVGQRENLNLLEIKTIK